MMAAGPAGVLGRTATALARRATRGYVVGGLVRDALLQRHTADVDIAVEDDALQVAPAVAAALGGRAITLDAENGVARVVPGQAAAGDSWQIDISTIRGDICQDLQRRDFTISAMAVDLECLPGHAAASLIDPCGGRADLAHRLVRSLGEAAFTADPVRLLRGVRLAAELGFEIETTTAAQMRRQARRLGGAPGERLREELLRLLAVPGAGSWLEEMDRLGLLTVLVPELEAGRHMQQPPEHHWDVLQHSLKTVTAVEFLLGQARWEYVSDDLRQDIAWPDAAAYFEKETGHGSTMASLIKLAALLHDIAKPPTRSFDASGRMRFLGHPAAGATITAAVLKRLRFSTRETRLVETMVAQHLRPTQMSHQGLPSHRAVYRFLRDCGEAAPGVLLLSLADHLASRGPQLVPDAWQAHAGIVNHVLAQRAEQAERTGPARLVDGHILMDALGLRPGPELGALLEAVKEAQAAGEVKTPQQAVDYARRRLAEADRGNR